MLTDQLAIKYAQALYEVASERGILEQAEEQLALVGSTLRDYEDLANLIYHPRVLPKAKKEVITRVFGQDLAEAVHNFLLLLVDKRRESILPSIIKEFKNLTNEARNIIEAEVTTALPLSDEQHTALAQKLGQVTGKNVILKTKIDANILGGVVVKIGDKLIDGSVARQLKMLQTTLMNAPVA